MIFVYIALKYVCKMTVDYKQFAGQIMIAIIDDSLLCWRIFASLGLDGLM